MTRRRAVPPRCSYVVPIRHETVSNERLHALASYLSDLTVEGCETVVLDASPPDVFAHNQRVLRWVSRHVAVSLPAMEMRLAARMASCEKIIVAAEDMRYGADEIRSMTLLLEIHEVVRPQESIEADRWWSGIDAAGILVERGMENTPRRTATIGCRRTALRGFRGLLALPAGSAPVGPELAAAAETFVATDVFVRRLTPDWRSWAGSRAALAAGDLDHPFRAAAFLAVIPAGLLFALSGGLTLAALYAALAGSIVTAVAAFGRGRAARIFPLWLCFLAPLWVAERSLSIYVALLRSVAGGAVVPATPATTDSGPDRRAVSS
ncbi:MAG TPA: hypothetical protein VNL91_10630 [Thermoanaerobaculia bacterium]|nr:hypothetical protein [Thermoanaerobaculia bacterium]